MDIKAACKAMGISTYDTSLPQDFVDMLYKVSDVNPYGHIVWSYDIARTFGEPVAVDGIGAHLLNIYWANRKEAK